MSEGEGLAFTWVAQSEEVGLVLADVLLQACCEQDRVQLLQTLGRRHFHLMEFCTCFNVSFSCQRFSLHQLQRTVV